MSGRHRPPNGFTLIELMVVTAIIAILAAIAFPSYADYVRKSRRADAKSMLIEIMQAQQRSFTANATYTTDLTDLSYGAASNLATEGGYYQISATACGTGINACVLLTAVPQSPQDADKECENLTLDSTGTKGISGTSTVKKCW